MGRMPWTAAAVGLVAVGALLATPNVRRMQRPDKPQLEHSAHRAVAD
jgi:hypothetical protein